MCQEFIKFLRQLSLPLGKESIDIFLVESTYFFSSLYMSVDMMLDKTRLKVDIWNSFSKKEKKMNGRLLKLLLYHLLAFLKVQKSDLSPRVCVFYSIELLISLPRAHWLFRIAHLLFFNSFTSWILSSRFIKLLHKISQQHVCLTWLTYFIDWKVPTDITIPGGTYV